MELSHKPEWASHLMETVEFVDFFHHFPLSEKDKKELENGLNSNGGMRQSMRSKTSTLDRGGHQTSMCLHYFGCIFQDVHLWTWLL